MSERQYWQKTDLYMWLCPDCGAMVGNRAQHDEWHAELDEPGEQA